MFRAQKAAIEFFWIGGQQVDVLSKTFPLEGFADFSQKELSCWVSNISWSLKQYEDIDKPLVVWDIIAALLAFNRSIPNYVDCILVKWLSSLCLGSPADLSTKKVLSHVSKNVSKISTRLLHLVNIICRCVILSDLKADEINGKMLNLEEIYGSAEEKFITWMELLLNSEKELRERLVAFSFSAFITLSSHSTSNWCPEGIVQMEQWVAHNHEHVRDQLKVLASQVVGHKRRYSFCLTLYSIILFMINECT